MIAVDTNILVYAHREDSPWHEPAYRAVAKLAEGSGAWAIPWAALHEFIAIETHPRILAPPTPLSRALDQVEAWIDSPTLHLLSEAPGYYESLHSLLKTAKITGPQVHDARIAAVCLQHGVRELWTADRDFSRFPALHVRNPLG